MAHGVYGLILALIES